VTVGTLQQLLLRRHKTKYNTPYSKTAFLRRRDVPTTYLLRQEQCFWVRQKLMGGKGRQAWWQIKKGMMYNGHWPCWWGRHPLCYSAVFYSALLLGTLTTLIKHTTHTKQTKKQTDIRTNQEHTTWPDLCQLLHQPLILVEEAGLGTVSLERQGTRIFQSCGVWA
jgi:hypothetical protein